MDGKELKAKLRELRIEHGVANDADLKEFLQTSEGKALFQKYAEAMHGKKIVDLAIKEANGRYLIPGQRLTVGGKPYFVVQHLDKAIGHYMIAPDLSAEEGNAPTAAMRVLFHAPTVKWVKESMENPADVLDMALNMAAKFKEGGS